MKRRKFDSGVMDRILIAYAEICVERGYHPRFVARRMREFEDAYDNRNN